MSTHSKQVVDIIRRTDTTDDVLAELGSLSHDAALVESLSEYSMHLRLKNSVNEKGLWCKKENILFDFLHRFWSCGAPKSMQKSMQKVEYVDGWVVVGGKLKFYHLDIRDDYD